MRVNIYAEELTQRVEIVTKTIDGVDYTGVRFYLELPCTDAGSGGTFRGPFIHKPGDDDSAAVTFWGKKDLKAVLEKALEVLEEHRRRPVAADLQPPSPEARPTTPYELPITDEDVPF